MEPRRLALRFLAVSFLFVFFAMSSLAWTRMALLTQEKGGQTHTPTTLAARR